MAGDRHVVGGITHDLTSLLVRHQNLIGAGFGGIAVVEKVTAKLPKIIESRHWGLVEKRFWQLIIRIAGISLLVWPSRGWIRFGAQNSIDIDGIETCEL